MLNKEENSYETADIIYEDFFLIFIIITTDSS